MEKNYNVLDLIKSLVKWKRYVIYFCIASAIGSGIVSLILPEYYSSQTMFFAASTDQIKPELFYGNQSRKLNYYGDRNDIDRILTIAGSDELKFFLIDSFYLYQHYEIDTGDIMAMHKVRRKFDKHFDLKKTAQDALLLRVEDKDKHLAAKMANAARDEIDNIAQKIICENQSKMLFSIKKNINKKESLLQDINKDLIIKREKYGVYNTITQSESMTSYHLATQTSLVSDSAKLEIFKKTEGVHIDTLTMLKARIEGKRQRLNVLNEKLKMFNEGVSIILDIEQQFIQLSQNLSKDKEKKLQYEAIQKAGISSVIIVEKAKVPLIRSRPERKLIVMASVVLTFIISTLGFLVYDLIKRGEWVN